jgi:hypothetical protein
MTITTEAEVTQAEATQEQTQAVAGLALARLETGLMEVQEAPLQQAKHHHNYSNSLQIGSDSKQRQGNQQANKQAQ